MLYSTCPGCSKPGRDIPGKVSKSGGFGRKSVRFMCPRCHRTWVVDREAAELHMRFLVRAGLAPSEPPARLEE